MRWAKATGIPKSDLSVTIRQIVKSGTLLQIKRLTCSIPYFGVINVKSIRSTARSDPTTAAESQQTILIGQK